MQYDFVCMNEECIRNERSFFKFNIESMHIMNRHQVKPIHPLTYSSMFVKQDATFQNLFKGEIIYAQLVQAKDQAFQTIIKITKEIFQENNLIPKIQKALSICDEMDSNKLCIQMSEGNYQLLKYLNQFQKENVNKNKNFKTFLMQKIKDMEKQAKNRFVQLKTSLLNQCNRLKNINKTNSVTLVNGPAQQTEIPIPANENITNFFKKATYIKQQYIPSIPKTTNEVFLQQKQTMQGQEYEQNLQDQEEQSQQQQEQQEDQQSSSHRKEPLIIQYEKTKQIKKKTKRKKRFVLTDIIEVVNQRYVIVKQSKNTAKTLQDLQLNHPNLAVLHIFDQKLATQSSIKFILNNFPSIKKISFNCYFQFETVVFKQTNVSMLKQLKLQLQWEMNLFFTEYYAYSYFPNKTKGRRQRKKIVHLGQMAHYLPSNNSLWVNDRISSANMHTLPLQQQNITVLNISNTQRDKIIITLPIRFRNISVLILKRIFILNKQCLRLFEMNKNIQTIILEQCFLRVNFQQQFLGISDLLYYAHKLTFLSKLSIKSEFIPPQSIFQLVDLTHLNLDYCTFQFKNESNYSEQLKGLSKLTKLQHLGLYGISQIQSSILAQLSFYCTNTLKYLNLGRTSIDKNVFSYLTRMKTIKYLNLDYTKIDGQSFTDYCFNMKSSNNLRYISIQGQLVEDRDKLTVQNLKQISNYQSELIYLNIAFNPNIHSYQFIQFNNLRTLAVDKHQYQQIQKIVSTKIYLYKVRKTKKGIV